MVLKYAANANTTGIDIIFDTYDAPGGDYNSHYSISINVYTNISGNTLVATATYGVGGNSGPPAFTSSTPTILWSAFTDTNTSAPFPPILNTYYYVLTLGTLSPAGTNTYPSNSSAGNSYVLPISGAGGGACFVAASQLLTATGYKSAADIKTGDLLMTADGRQVAVKAFSFTVENANKDSAPFLLPANSLGTSCPKADLRLSPWHAIQMKKGLWMKPMSAFELGAPIQQYDLGKSVTYYHFEAPNYFKDNFVCNGTVVESFGGKQLAEMKGRVYKYNPKMKAYTRLSAKPSKAIMM